MLTKNINFKNFKKKKTNNKVFSLLNKILNENNEIINSLNKFYIDSYSKKKVLQLKKYSEIVLIGMGGSILGARSIYNFLKNKIKKKFFSLMISSRLT